MERGYAKVGRRSQPISPGARMDRRPREKEMADAGNGFWDPKKISRWCGLEYAPFAGYKTKNTTLLEGATLLLPSVIITQISSVKLQQNQQIKNNH